MSWMRKLEQKYRKYAIPNLMKYVIMMYAVGALMALFAPGLYETYLALDFGKVLQGQVWRLVTFLLYPSDGSVLVGGTGLQAVFGNILFLGLFFLLYYSIGMSLERRWGTFAFNLFFLMGVLFHIVAAAINYVAFGASLLTGTYYLNLSMFFAFVTEFPDTQFRIMYVIPVKAKWLGIVDAIFFGATIIGGFAMLFDVRVLYLLLRFGIYTSPQNAVAAAVSALNYVLFYYIYRQAYRRTKEQRRVQKEFKSQMARLKKEQAVRMGQSRHRCAVCGRTELTNPELEFRFCSKCEGAYEYCQDHLYTHQHVTKQ